MKQKRLDGIGPREVDDLLVGQNRVGADGLQARQQNEQENGRRQVEPTKYAHVLMGWMQLRG